MLLKKKKKNALLVSCEKILMCHQLLTLLHLLQTRQLLCLFVVYVFYTFRKITALTKYQI